MSSEIVEFSLNSLCLLVADCPHATPKWTDSGFIVLRNQNIKNGRLDMSAPSFTDEEHYLGRIRRAAPQKDDIVITREAPMGEVCRIPAGLKCCLGQRQVLLRPDPDKVDSQFLLYALQSPYLQNQIGWNEGTGYTVSNLRIPVLEALKVPTPALAAQHEIASTLGALDDRIALLRETNATLEAIAQALFKTWFVDFDPVRAKASLPSPCGRGAGGEGNHSLHPHPNPLPQGEGAVLPLEIASLFPDSFEESELGFVPSGWVVTPIYELATYINGAAYKAFEPNSECRGFPIIKIAELKSGVTTQTAYSDVAMPEKYRITTGDILFSWSGNPDTSIDTFVWHHGQAWLNQHIFRVIPHATEERSFVLQMLKHLRPTFAELARNKQTTGLGHVTVADMKRLHVIHPDKIALDLFHEIVAPIHERMFKNEKQAQTLATLRDTLLPRLISGRLRLPEVSASLV